MTTLADSFVKLQTSVLQYFHPQLYTLATTGGPECTLSNVRAYHN